MKDKIFLFIKELWQNLKPLLFLFLDWVFKNKFVLITTFLAIFITYTIGTIFATINIPDNAIEGNFVDHIRIVLSSALIESTFSWQFIFFLFTILLSIYFFRKHVQRVIAIILTIFLIKCYFFIHNFSNTDLAKLAYIEMTGYPKVVKKGNNYYTLLGTNKEVYDLNKSLTAERCAIFNEANQLSPSEVYYTLIQRIDLNTRPNSAQPLDGNITYLNYDDSLHAIRQICMKYTKKI
jgi:hypothetical protein